MPLPKNRVHFSLSIATLGLLLSAQAQALSTLVYGAPGEPVALNAGSGIDSPSLQAEAQLYNRLIDFKPGTAELIPALATSWKSNADATVWTFTLRQGVKFHDGTPFNADAVLFNVNRWWNKADPNRFGASFEIWPQLLGGNKGEAGSFLKSVAKRGDSTVIFTLNKPVTAFPALIGSYYFGIASPTAVKKQGVKYGTPAGGAVGTGPFTYQSWKTGDRLTMTANKTYWGQKAKVEQLVFRFIKDPAQRLNEVKAGAIDFTSNLNPEAVAQIKADQHLQMLLPPPFNVGLLNMNVRNAALKNTKVREAIRFAINRPAIVEAFWGELGKVDNNLLPASMSWANSKGVPGVTYTPQNVQVAKRLLSEAGYPNGFSIDLWYPPISRAYLPNPKPVAEAIAADLASIGIRVNLKTEDWAKYLEDRHKGVFDMYLYGWSGDYNDPDNFYSAFYGDTGSDDIGFNPGNILILRILSQGRAATTQAGKATYYRQLHELTYNANVRIPLVHSAAPSVARTYVKGWVLGPLSTVSALNLIRIEK